MIVTDYVRLIGAIAREFPSHVACLCATLVLTRIRRSDLVVREFVLNHRSRTLLT